MFTKMYVWARNRVECDEGATAVEYGIMVAGIAVLIIAAVWALGGGLVTLFNSVVAAIS